MERRLSWTASLYQRVAQLLLALKRCYVAAFEREFIETVTGMLLTVIPRCRTDYFFFRFEVRTVRFSASVEANGEGKRRSNAAQLYRGIYTRHRPLDCLDWIS
jgi:hypothetical protein